MSPKPENAHQLLLALILLLGLSPAAADEGPDLSRWNCRFCITPGQHWGQLQLGSVYADGPQYGPQAYLGVDEKGQNLLANGRWVSRNDNGIYLDLAGADLGLDSRRLALRTGQPGRIRLSLDYRSIPRLLSDTARSPFAEVGPDNLRLPADWQPAGSTTAMPGLRAGAVQRVLRRDRRDWRAALRVSPGQRWDLDLRVRQQVSDGDRVTGGSFVSKASLLPHTINWTISELEATGGYSGERWQSQIGYLATLFRNESNGLGWDNPYKPIREGAERGRLAQPPDNDWHRLMLSQRWQPTRGVGLNWQLMAGRATQNQPFLPATENPNIRVEQPRDALDGQLDMRSGKFGLSLRPHRGLRFQARYWLDERKNRSAVALWQPVLTDVEELEPRANRPYSFRREQSRARLSLGLGGGWRVRTGIQTEQRERELQQIELTSTDSSWLELGWRRPGGNGLSLRLSGSERDGERFGDVSGLPAPENPRMRQFHLADRDQRELSLRWQARIAPLLNLNLQLARAANEYLDSPVGLQSSSQWRSSLSLAWVSADGGLTVTSFLSSQRIEAELRNSANFSSADWSADSRDTLLAFGLSVQRPLQPARTGLGIDYQASNNSGDLQVNSGSPGDAFPAVDVRLHSLKAHLDFPLRPHLALSLGYELDYYSGADWARDAVDLDTIDNVLGLGPDPAERNLNLFSVSLRLTL